MKLRKGNILDLTGYTPDPCSEWFETLFNAGNCRIERIVSSGQTTPGDEWYDQEHDEWVVLLQGKAKIEFDNHAKYEFVTGDYMFIPAHSRHRVIYTSSEPDCVWLAIHGDITL